MQDDDEDDDDKENQKPKIEVCYDWLTIDELVDSWVGDVFQVHTRTKHRASMPGIPTTPNRNLHHQTFASTSSFRPSPNIQNPSTPSARLAAARRQLELEVDNEPFQDDDDENYICL